VSATAIADDLAGIDFERIQRLLHSRFPGPFEDAEDAVQDACLDFLIEPEKFDSITTGYLLKRARWKLLTARRLRRPTASLDTLAAFAPKVLATATAVRPPELQAIMAPPGKPTEIAEKIRAYHDRTGVVPTERLCKREPSLPATTTIERHYGKFSAAVRAAGLVPRGAGRRNQRWEKHEVAEVFVAFRRRHGHWPDARDRREEGSTFPTDPTLVRIFGSSRLGVIVAGIEPLVAT